MCKTCGCHSHGPDHEHIHVEGMTCEHCKESVEKTVLGLPGVMAAEVDLGANQLTVTFDHHKTSLQRIKQAVDEIGFAAH